MLLGSLMFSYWYIRTGKASNSKQSYELSWISGISIFFSCFLLLAWLAGCAFLVLCCFLLLVACCLLLLACLLIFIIYIIFIVHFSYTATYVRTPPPAVRRTTYDATRRRRRPPQHRLLSLGFAGRRPHDLCLTSIALFHIYFIYNKWVN